MPFSTAFLARALLALFLFGSGSGCMISGSGTAAKERAAELSAARQASRDGRWTEAVGRWNAILQRADENSLEACAQASRALLELRDPNAAQHLAELGLRTFPKAVELHVIRAEALVGQAFPHAAETAYENALRSEPDRADVVRALAALRCDLGRDATALALLEPRLAAKDATAADFALAGRAQRALGQFPAAFESYGRAFELGPASPEQLVGAASMYAEESVRKTNARAAALAKGWLLRATQLDPQATLGHVYLGLLAEDEQRDDDAAVAYRRAAETDPACVLALTSLALVQARRGELDDSMAIAALALALEKDPQKRAVLDKLANPDLPAAPPTPSEVGEITDAPPTDDG